jgi:hypothetical protein
MDSLRDQQMTLIFDLKQQQVHLPPNHQSTISLLIYFYLLLRALGHLPVSDWQLWFFTQRREPGKILDRPMTSALVEMTWIVDRPHFEVKMDCLPFP